MDNTMNWNGAGYYAPRQETSPSTREQFVAWYRLNATNATEASAEARSANLGTPDYFSSVPDWAV